MSDRLSFKDWYLKEIWHGIFNYIDDCPINFDKLKLSEKNSEHMAWCYQQQRIVELEESIHSYVRYVDLRNDIRPSVQYHRLKKMLDKSSLKF